MMKVVGIVFGLICVFSGYLLHHGSLVILAIAWTELIVILGATIGIFLASNDDRVMEASDFGDTRLAIPSDHLSPGNRRVILSPPMMNCLDECNDMIVFQNIGTMPLHCCRHQLLYVACRC